MTRAENRPKCTCLCCNNFHFHHTKLTRENLVSLDSWQIFLDRIYFSLCRFSDRFFAVEFKKHVIQLLPIFGRFYYVQMNEFTHPFIKSTHPHIQYQKKALWVANLPKINHVGSVHSANQNRDFKCSVIVPAKPKLKTKWRRGKQLFIRFATFIWIISSFCVDILTKCLTVFINKVIILVHVPGSLIDFGGVFGVKIHQISSATFLRLGVWVANGNKRGCNQEKIINIIVLNGFVSFLFNFAANIWIYICLNDEVYLSTRSFSGSRMKRVFIFYLL